jgi:ubiquinol-cytochrome c reductase cytochrome b subunit
MFVLVIDCVVLGWCGANPPEGYFVPLARVGTLYYFFHFIVLLPVLGKIERPLPLPPSIADSVLKKKAV